MLLLASSITIEAIWCLFRRDLAHGVNPQTTTCSAKAKSRCAGSLIRCGETELVPFGAEGNTKPVSARGMSADAAIKVPVDHVATPAAGKNEGI